MDLSEKTNLPFVGEMHPDYITEFDPVRAHTKIHHHETHHDERIGIDEYIHVLENKDKYIIQINDAQHFMLPYADIFLLRKNVNNILFSQGNLLLKAHPAMTEDLVYRWMSLLINPIKLVYTYVYKKNITPVWYEDYFNDYPCLTPFLDRLPKIEEFKEHVDSLYLNYLSDKILNQ